jgi:hypothetical protein
MNQRQSRSGPARAENDLRQLADSVPFRETIAHLFRERARLLDICG